MSNRMNIERVSLNDCEELLKIYAPYVEKTAITFEYEVPSKQEFSERIKNISARLPYIKAVENGEIVGYAYATTFKGRKAYDWSVEATVYVREDCKRKGIGRKLYECLEKSLAEIGILNINACIARPNEEDEYLTNDSMLFHESMGYKLVGTFHDCGYKFNRWYSMIWMEKMLGEHTNSQPEVRFGEWTI